jgi:DNA-binding transcriptional MerR regulator
MEKTVREFMENLLADLKNIDYIKPEDIPNIALYMDQVTTFMDEQLAASKRHEDDKILTKTMINNYAKNNLLPPPEKKKYSREHVLTLLFIYYFKNILSISDIQSILNPITDRYFGNKDGFNMQDIYNEVFALEMQESQKVFKDLGKKYIISNNTFTDFPEEDQDFLHAFAFICQLSYDVYIKKMIIEQIIDDINGREHPSDEDSAKKERTAAKQS